MCGLVGILNRQNSRAVELPEIKSMTAMLGHRGPDGVGYYLDQQLGLGHTRLSIIDIAGGAQPIHNEDSTVWVVFNGEIFNYVELREQLQRQGHRFSTFSDTEVIVHAYEEYGLDFPNHLNGQFAIALWDKPRQQLVLVRDRVGIHPLFYSMADDRLIFASEIKAILPVVDKSPRLNPAGLDQIMTFWSPIDDSTIFQDIKQVRPGEIITITNKLAKRDYYWQWNYPEDSDYESGSSAKLAERLRELLADAVRIRLRSDVPVGAYLSGGLDSSVLTALIHEQGQNLRTFSIGFNNSGLDETEYQQIMIDHLDTQHSRILCNESDIGNSASRAIWHAECPILRTAPIPMMLLSGLVRQQNYKVVLTGEGSDEVLGGYDIFKEAKIRAFWARNSASKFRPLLLQKLYPYLDIAQGRAPAYLQAFFGMGLDQPDNPCFSHIPRWTTTAHCKNFYSDNFRTQLKDDAEQIISAILPENIGSWHRFNRAQYIEAKTLMPGYLLSSQGDRMLMANSVEGRFPFLDHRIIEFASRIHPNLKMNVLNEKYLLKQAMQDDLPSAIIERYKQPYRAPDIPAFFQNSNPLEFVNDMLSNAEIKRTDYFDVSKVNLLLRKISSGKAIGYKDNMAFIGILTTQMWHRLFIDNHQKIKSGNVVVY